MITNAILLIFYVFANLLVSFLAVFGEPVLPTQITDSIPVFASYYSTLNTIFPVTTILIIIGFQTAIELAIFTYKMIKWAYTKIPGVG